METSFVSGVFQARPAVWESLRAAVCRRNRSRGGVWWQIKVWVEGGYLSTWPVIVGLCTRRTEAVMKRMTWFQSSCSEEDDDVNDSVTARLPQGALAPGLRSTTSWFLTRGWCLPAFSRSVWAHGKAVTSATVWFSSSSC